MLFKRQEQRLWELQVRPRASHLFRSYELSRRFTPAWAFAVSYQLNERFSARLQWQQTIGTVALTETEYQRRSTITMQIEPTLTRRLVNASFSSLGLGLTYRL